MELAPFDLFARDHHGLVTRRAAVRAGMSDRTWYRAIENGQLELVHPGVARMFGSEPTPAQAICAAVLASGSGAMASHRSAAWLWGIPAQPTDPVDVLLPRRSREAAIAGAAIHRPRDLIDLTPVRRTNIPTTNILRTLCDLGALDSNSVSAAVGHVVSTGMASPAALWAAIARHSRRGRPGVPALRMALSEWLLDGKPVDSILEPAMRRLLARHGLPTAEFHAVIAGYEVDFWIVDSPIVLECDGWSTHGLNKSQFEKDRTRDAELAAMGYIVLRFTYRGIIKRPAKEAERIRRNVRRWAPHLLGGIPASA
jgi:very-short-patch-repair endonuclease